MKKYEAVREIFNKCSGNQMRDVLFDEMECDDLDAFITATFKDKDFTYEKTVLEDGTVVFDIMTSGIKQRYTFSEI